MKDWWKFRVTDSGKGFVWHENIWMGNSLCIIKWIDNKTVRMVVEQGVWLRFLYLEMFQSKNIFLLNKHFIILFILWIRLVQAEAYGWVSRRPCTTMLGLNNYCYYYYRQGFYRTWLSPVQKSVFKCSYYKHNPSCSKLTSRSVTVPGNNTVDTPQVQGKRPDSKPWT